MPFTSSRTEEAYATAKQALDNDELIYIARIGWTEPLFGGQVQWLEEPSAVVQAIESAGWQLESLNATADNSTNRVIALFRRDMR